MSAELLHTELVELAAREQLDVLDGDSLIAFVGKKGFMTLRLILSAVRPLALAMGI